MNEFNWLYIILTKLKETFLSNIFVKLNELKEIFDLNRIRIGIDTIAPFFIVPTFVKLIRLFFVIVTNILFYFILLVI